MIYIGFRNLHRTPVNGLYHGKQYGNNGHLITAKFAGNEPMPFHTVTFAYHPNGTVPAAIVLFHHVEDACHSKFTVPAAVLPFHMVSTRVEYKWVGARSRALVTRGVLNMPNVQITYVFLGLCVVFLRK